MNAQQRRILLPLAERILRADGSNEAIASALADAFEAGRVHEAGKRDNEAARAMNDAIAALDEQAQDERKEGHQGPARSASLILRAALSKASRKPSTPPTRSHP